MRKRKPPVGSEALNSYLKGRKVVCTVALPGRFVIHLNDSRTVTLTATRMRGLVADFGYRSAPMQSVLGFRR
jgi:hypothetical protein